MLRYLPFFVVLTFLTACSSGGAQDNLAGPDLPAFTRTVSETIQLNQVGIYPGSTLRFSVVVDDAAPPTSTAPAAPPSYYLVSTDNEQTVASGELGALNDWSDLAGTRVHYTETPAPPTGTYRIYVPDHGYSAAFTVADNVYREVLVASVRSNFLQRMGMDLEEKHAGVYARKGGHPDTDVLYHPSSGRRGKTSSPGGWYDAGDYNKYVVNGAFPLGQYLTLYEEAPGVLGDGDLNLPESGNGVSDYLDELRYELDWLLTMQDTDGGVFHKVTALAFEGIVMPTEATSQRYMVGKSAEATLDFAAALAQAARVYEPVDAAYAGRLLTAAERAWTWGVANPNVHFKNPKDVSTGEYGDVDASQEKAWAAVELFVTTGESAYLNTYRKMRSEKALETGEGWRGYMAKLAMFSLLRHESRVPEDVYQTAKTTVISLADSLVALAGGTAYRQPITRWVWGSNSDVLNAAMLVAAAQRVAPKPAYRDFVQACVDYTLGHNPLGYSFVTGFGTRSPMHIHHRPSMADDVESPFPGFLSGGPNVARQDSAWATYPVGAAPMEMWVDQDGSYASNEICLNWNAPLTYVIGFLEANQAAR